MKKILIADDNDSILESLKQMFAPYYEVDLASTGIEIYQMCETTNYDGLLVDIDFGPGISGLTVAEAVHEMNQMTKIVVFSAKSPSNATLQLISNLDARFCEKPIQVDAIRSILEA
jgi:DNA-binding NtrC family response regulator